MRNTLRSLVSVIGPTSLITALLFYFGWVRTRTQAADLGFEVSMMDTSTQATLLRSLSSVYQPLGALLLAGVIGLLAHWALASWIRSPLGGPDPEVTRRRRARAVRWIVGVVGGAAVVIFATGAWAALIRRWEVDLWPWGPICLGAGVALGSYAVHIGLRFGTGTERHWGTDPELRWIPTLMATLVVLLVAAALFWAVSDYAVAVGHRQHDQLVARLSTRPDVTVYSKDRLHLDHQDDEVRETTLEDADGGYRFRYDGLKLLFLAQGKYFLLPETWTEGKSSAIVLPDDSSLRFEFVRGFPG